VIQHFFAPQQGAPDPHQGLPERATCRIEGPTIPKCVDQQMQNVTSASQLLQEITSSMCPAQFNASCSAAERDIAGEEVLKVFMRERILFLQDLPWWYKRFGLLPVMRIKPLRPFLRGPQLLLRWMQLQFSYVSQLEGCCTMMVRGFHRGFSLPQGASPRAALVNAIVGRQVRTFAVSMPRYVTCSNHLMAEGLSMQMTSLRSQPS